MRDKLVEIFGLKPVGGQTEVSDEQIITAATWHKAQADSAEAKRQEEREISDLVTKSCGALSRASAKEVLAARKNQTKK
jgi:hypothetical protein